MTEQSWLYLIGTAAIVLLVWLQARGLSEAAAAVAICAVGGGTAVLMLKTWGRK